MADRPSGLTDGAAIGRRPMAPADAAWYRMDRPTNHMVITSVLTFDEPLDPGRVRELLRERLVEGFPPFRRRVVASGPLGRPHWEEDPLFDLDLHVHRRGLPAPGDQAALQALVADLMTRGLDPDRPLWDVHVVDGYGAGGALVTRIHHCIADGIALAQVMLTLTDASSPPAPGRPAPPRTAGSGSLPLGAVTEPVRAVAGLGLAASSALAHEAAELLLHPGHLLDLGREAGADASALLGLLTAPAEQDTTLKGPFGVAQRVGWTPPLPLGPIKDVAHETGTTVNDVLLAALGGALARHLDARGEDVAELHVMVPFNVRPPGEPLPAELGNRFGLILLGLPLRSRSPRARVAEVHHRMQDIKRSRQPAMSYAAIGALGSLPAPVEAWMVDLLSAKSTSIVTNVPGPRTPVRVAGIPVREVLIWAPCAGSVGMSVSIFSYRDTVTVGFMAHAELLPDPGALAGALQTELADLGAAAYT